MEAKITDLPYLVVRNIFKYLTLNDIIYIDRVIPEWTSIQRDYLRKLANLTLLLGNNDPMLLIRSSSISIPFEDEIVEENRFNPYWIIEINRDQIEHLEQLELSQLMPSVTHLEVAVKGVHWWSINQSIVPLIRSWADQLISFKFRYNRFKDLGENRISLSQGDQSSKLLSLFECINTRMMKLERLHIDVSGSHCFSKHSNGQADLSILPQLQEFRFHSDDKAKILFEKLNQYATDRLRTIAIGNNGSWEKILSNFGASSFAKRIVIFSDDCTPHHLCTSFFTAFDSLRSVMLSLNNNNPTTLPQLTHYLSPLRNLVHLNLAIYTNVSRFDSISDEHIHPLPVRVVTLSTGEGSLPSHDALQSRHWPRMFPACRILVFTNHQECNECEWYGTDCNGEPYPLRENYKQCCKHFLAPFRRLPNLCKIYCDSFFSETYKDLQNIEQL